jgi:alpha-L-fucosidase 2
MSVKTGYNGFGKELTSDYAELNKISKEIVGSAFELPYSTLRERHTNDWAGLYSRVEFALGDPDAEKPPMNERLAKVAAGELDMDLYTTYFQFVRYLMIAASREGCEPTTLQGIWSEKPRPEWSCNYTININTQMNYWMAGVCNLYECEDPLVRMVEELSISGRETAKETFCSEG